ncbi:hypothetical protein AB0G02_22740, partial [Actinosynnema sp. NPDC023658]
TGPARRALPRAKRFSEPARGRAPGVGPRRPREAQNTPAESPRPVPNRPHPAPERQRRAPGTERFPGVAPHQGLRPGDPRQAPRPPVDDRGAHGNLFDEPPGASRHPHHRPIPRTPEQS